MTDVNGVSGERLKQVVDKIEHLEEEKREASNEVNVAYKDAESQGYDKKALKLVIAKRRQSKEALEALEQLVDVYERALGG